MPVEVDAEIKTFTESQFHDLLFARGLIVEAKTVEKLNNAHHSQTLNYLLLTEMRHGLLLNLRTDKVEKRFVSTKLDLK